MTKYQADNLIEDVVLNMRTKLQERLKDTSDEDKEVLGNIFKAYYNALPKKLRDMYSDEDKWWDKN